MQKVTATGSLSFVLGFAWRLLVEPLKCSDLQLCLLFHKAVLARLKCNREFSMGISSQSSIRIATCSCHHQLWFLGLFCLEQGLVEFQLLGICSRYGSLSFTFWESALVVSENLIKSRIRDYIGNQDRECRQSNWWRNNKTCDVEDHICSDCQDPFSGVRVC